MTRRNHLTFLVVAVVLSFGVVYGFVSEPTYTDAYYYINAANRLVTGEGLTDAAIWTYIGMPEQLPTPSHTYWMPMASLVSALGMWIFNAPGSYWAAQFPFALLLLLIGYSAFWLGGYFGANPLQSDVNSAADTMKRKPVNTSDAVRVAWAAGIMTILGGYFARFWGMTETFTPFGAFGVGALIALCRGIAMRDWRWFAMAGALSAGAHMTRADGLLLVLAGGAALLWPWDRNWTWRGRIVSGFVLVIAYLIAMSPWFIRNLSVIGTPLPVGGTQGIWYTEYNDIFSFPPDATPERFFEMGGWSLFIASRWTALTNGFGTLVMVQGFAVMFPLMMIGLFRRLREPFLRPFWIYALGLHLAMTLVFPFPGYRGGLFHSAAALMPFWTVLGVVGLDDAIDWIARRRRTWNPRTAKPVFTMGLVFIVGALSGLIGMSGRAPSTSVSVYNNLSEIVPADARIMVNDPSALYYHTGRLAVVMPNESPEAILTIAERYQIDYLLLERVEDGVSRAATDPLRELPGNPPDFLTEIPFPDEQVRLYRFERAQPSS